MLSKLKKCLSMVLAFVLVLGLIVPGMTVSAAPGGSVKCNFYSNPPADAGVAEEKLLNQTVTMGNLSIFAGKFAIDGYKQTGWNTARDGSGTGYAMDGTITVASTLYAQWEVDNSEPTYDLKPAQPSKTLVGTAYLRVYTNDRAHSFDSLTNALVKYASSITIGEVEGNDNVGYSCQITVTLAHGDELEQKISASMAGKYPAEYAEGDWTYDFTQTANPLTFTIYNKLGTNKWWGSKEAIANASSSNLKSSVAAKIPVYMAPPVKTPTYTVTYTDGVEDEEVFADQVYTVDEGTATPEFDGTPSRTNYTFTGWEPEVAETVTGDVTYTAQWTATTNNKPAASKGLKDSDVKKMQIRVYAVDTINGAGEMQSITPRTYAAGLNKWEIGEIQGNDADGYTQTVTFYFETGDKLEAAARDIFNTDSHLQWPEEWHGDWTYDFDYEDFDAVQSLTFYWVPSKTITGKLTGSWKCLSTIGSGYAGNITSAVANHIKAYVYLPRTVTYTDGTGNEGIFADQVYNVRNGVATPAFDGTLNPHFTGWDPAVSDTVFGNTVYTATWSDHVWDDGVETKRATKYEEGEMLYTCTVCGATRTEVIPKLKGNANTLYYNANGGVGGPSNNFTNSLTATVQRSKPTREGYKFVCWNTEADGSGDSYKGGDTYTFVDEAGLGGMKVWLYAQWKPNTYTVSFNSNGGKAIDPVTVVYDSQYGLYNGSTTRQNLPSADAINGLQNLGWYIVNEDGTFSESAVSKTTYVKTARDHELFQQREIKSPSVTVVPASISGYYNGEARTLTASTTEYSGLVYSYQWYKNGEAIEGATDKVFTLDGNAADSGTYKVVVTVTKGDELANVITTSDSATGEKEVKVTIRKIANTLRLDFNNGTDVVYDSYTNGTSIKVRTPSSSVVREGYTFTGIWNSKADGSGTDYQIGDTYVFDGDTGNGGQVDSLYAQWTPNEYTITVDPANGEETYEITVTYEDTLGDVLPKDPTRTGYTFTGWVDQDGTPVDPEMPYTEGVVTEITATWTANDYTITLDANAGKVDPETVTVTYGAAIGKLPVPTREGYTFAGWTDKDGNAVTAETVYAVAGNSTLTASWTANKNAVTVDKADGSDPTVIEIPTGDTIGDYLPKDPTRDGYTFAGWVDQDGKAVDPTKPYAAGSITKLTATWKANTYTVTLDPNDGSKKTSTITVTFDQPIGKLPTPKRDGYTFAGWYTKDGKLVTADTVYGVAGDTTLYAGWSNGVKTGDSANVALYAAAMLVAVVAVAVLLRKKKAEQ